MRKKYSGNEIKKAGDILRKDSSGDSFHWAMDVLSFWRLKHEAPLEKAFKLIQEVASKNDNSAIFAKRLKRTPSIIKKLNRFETMTLKNMQDIGGCRVIFSNQKKLDKVLKILKKKGEFINSKGECREKDYISEPKSDGYRSYHLICNIDKMKIEIQLRTTVQHSWATAIEIVDLFTGQNLKTSGGKEVWKSFFKEVADQFAIIEEIGSFYLNDRTTYLKYNEMLKSDEKQKKIALSVKKAAKKLEVIKKLEAFAGSLKVIEQKEIVDENTGYVLLKIDLKERMLYTMKFGLGSNVEAEEKYISEEKKAAKNEVVVLVSTTAMGNLRHAYPNYFADSEKFLKNLQFITNLDRWELS